MTEKKTEQDVKVSDEVIVVEQLPSQQVRAGLSEDGKTNFNFITRDEALTEILKTIRDIKKGITG